jgi:hypothetical protein
VDTIPWLFLKYLYFTLLYTMMTSFNDLLVTALAQYNPSAAASTEGFGLGSTFQPGWTMKVFLMEEACHLVLHFVWVGNPMATFARLLLGGFLEKFVIMHLCRVVSRRTLNIKSYFENHPYPMH